MNQSFTNRKQNDDSSSKKRVIKIKQNNDNLKISLKQKIHKIKKKKEALIKQYSNKNKVVFNSDNNNMK